MGLVQQPSSHIISDFVSNISFSHTSLFLIENGPLNPHSTSALTFEQCFLGLRCYLDVRTWTSNDFSPPMTTLPSLESGHPHPYLQHCILHIEARSPSRYTAKHSTMVPRAHMHPRFPQPPRTETLHSQARPSNHTTPFPPQRYAVYTAKQNPSLWASFSICINDADRLHVLSAAKRCTVVSLYRRSIVGSSALIGRLPDPM